MLMDDPRSCKCQNYWDIFADEFVFFFLSRHVIFIYSVFMNIL